MTTWWEALQKSGQGITYPQFFTYSATLVPSAESQTSSTAFATYMSDSSIILELINKPRVRRPSLSQFAVQMPQEGKALPITYSVCRCWWRTMVVVHSPIFVSIQALLWARSCNWIWRSNRSLLSSSIHCSRRWVCPSEAPCSNEAVVWQAEGQPLWEHYLQIKICEHKRCA